MPRLAARMDANQREIVYALRSVGATVHLIQSVREGCPDLLIGFRRKTYLMEVKTDRGQLRPGQRRWHRGWQGRPVSVARNIEEALCAIQKEAT